jgi:hypothetical protein
MTPVVVDTDVVSFLFKNDSRAQLYLPIMRNRDLVVSFMTEAELEQWILLAKWGVDRVRRFRVFMTGFASVPSSRLLLLLRFGGPSCRSISRWKSSATMACPPRDAIYQGCLIRFRPIMMTTMAALLGAVPIALGYGAGGEARQPLGLVVGGLLFSQLVTLYLTPVFYIYMSALEQWVQSWRRGRGLATEVPVEG